MPRARKRLEYELAVKDSAVATLTRLEQRLAVVDRRFMALEGSSGSATNVATAGFTKLLGVVGTFASAAALGGAIKQFAAFERQMALVGTLSDEAANKLPRLTVGIREMALESGQSLDALAKAEFDVVSATGDVENSLELLEVAMQLAVAGGTDVATTMDAITTVLNAYGLDATHAREVSDALFTAMKAGKVTIAELAGSLGQVAPAAARAGVGVDGLFASLGAATKVLKADIAATSLRSLFAKIETATDAQRQRADELARSAGVMGFALSKAHLQSVGIARFLQDLARLSREDAGLLKELGFEIESLAAGSVLMANDGQKIVETLGSMETAAGATAKGFELMEETLSQKLAKINAGLDEAKLRFVEGFAKELSDGSEDVAASMKRMGDAAEQAGQQVAQVPTFLRAVEVARLQLIERRLEAETRFQRLLGNTDRMEEYRRQLLQLRAEIDAVAAPGAFDEINEDAKQFDKFMGSAADQTARIRKELEGKSGIDQLRDDLIAMLDEFAATQKAKQAAVPQDPPNVPLTPEEVRAGRAAGDREQGIDRRLEEETRRAQERFRLAGLEGFDRQWEELDIRYSRLEDQYRDHVGRLEEIGRARQFDEAALRRGIAAAADRFDAEFAALERDYAAQREEAQQTERQRRVAAVNLHYSHLLEQAREFGADEAAVERARVAALERIRSDADLREIERRQRLYDAIEEGGVLDGFAARMAEIQDDTSRLGRLGADAADAIADGFGNGAVSALDAYIDKSQSVGDAFSNMAAGILRDLSALILKHQTLKLVAGAFDGIGLGASNFGLDVPGKAAGGIAGRRGQELVRVGERGPEAVVPLSGGRSVPVELRGMSGGGTTIVQHITFAPQVHAIDAAGVAEWMDRHGPVMANQMAKQMNQHAALRQQTRDVAKGN